MAKYSNPCWDKKWVKSEVSFNSFQTLPVYARKPQIWTILVQQGGGGVQNAVTRTAMEKLLTTHPASKVSIKFILNFAGVLIVWESSQMIRFPDPMAGHKSVKFDFPDINSFMNNVTKDRWPIPMDTTVRLGPLKFSLQATIDHHGPSIHSGNYTASINCCKKKHSIATITRLRSLELLIKTTLLHILYYINWLTHDFWTWTGGWDFDRSHGVGTSSPSHWQQVEEQAPKPVGWTMCYLLMTLVHVQKLCVNIYINIYAFLIRVML